MDVLYALQQFVRADTRDCDRARSFHHGFLVDSYRAKFHRHNSQDAGAWHDVVPVASFYLGFVWNERDFYSWYAGNRDHRFPAGA